MKLLLLMSIAGLALAATKSVTIDCTNAAAACNNDCYAIYKNHKRTSLHYMANKRSTTLNRRLSGCTKNPCRKTKFKASGDDCDEYPYASTKEGGKDSTLRCIPASENRSEGAQLGNFYKKDAAKGGCGLKPCTYQLYLKNYSAKTPYCTQKGNSKNDGYQFKLKGNKFVSAKARRAVEDEFEADDIPEDAEILPLHRRREFELEDGSRILMLVGDHEVDYNGTLVADGTSLEAPGKLIVRELFDEDKSHWFR